MNKALLTLLLLCATCHAAPETQPQKDSPSYKTTAEKRKALWKDFHKARFEKYGKFQDIRIYAEDDDLTRVCYISEDGLFIFRWGKSTGTIEKVRTRHTCPTTVPLRSSTKLLCSDYSQL